MRRAGSGRRIFSVPALISNAILASLGHASLNITNVYAETDLQMEAKA
jgi:hypothetical protein